MKKHLAPSFRSAIIDVCCAVTLADAHYENCRTILSQKEACGFFVAAAEAAGRQNFLLALNDLSRSELSCEQQGAVENGTGHSKVV
jgi:hypothetical protein